MRSPLRLAEPPVPEGFTGTRLTACNLCEAICGLELTLTDGKVTGIRGNPDDPLSRGYICPKGVALADVYDDPDRLRRPIRRVSTGSSIESDWEEIGWDEALDLVADGLADALNQHGRDAVGVYLGNPNAHALGSATHAVPFVKSLRTRNRFSASTVDQVPHQLVAWQMFGHQLLLPIPDLDRTSYLLVLGANPMASNGSLMTTPDFPNRAKAIKQRGGRIVVLDPRRTETAAIATEHVFVRPGGDVVVLLAMLRTILAEGLARPPAYVDGLDELRALVDELHPCSRRAGQRRAGRDRRASGARAVRDARRRGLRPARRLRDRLRLGQPVGDQLPQPPRRRLRPAGRGDVPRAGGRRGGPTLRRDRPLRPLPQPGPRTSGVRRRAPGRVHARGDRDAR